MSSSTRPFRLLAAAVAALAALAASAQERYPGIGRVAAAKEIQAWDIDVRPDFKGLPPGRGTVAQGQRVWEAQCAGCHGIFGESGAVFMPLVGGSTARDIEAGRVARLTDPAFPMRSTTTKLSTVSTLWDYIHRAMPWAAPKSLTHDQVYAVIAYLLNLADVLPADFELSPANIAQVQQRIPNRLGMSSAHALWPGREFEAQAKPDVQGNTCMQNCAAPPTIASSLPEGGQASHGNLAQQQRSVGAQRGAVTADTAAAAAPQ
jgi:S-disulfanyl-L-cysteine oxidoreductase SoxD